MSEYNVKRPGRAGPKQRAWDAMDDERRRIEITLGYGKVKNTPFHIRHHFDELVTQVEQLLTK